MPLELFDTHCHLDLIPRPDVAAVLARARTANIVGCVSIGTTVEASRINLEIAGQHPAMVRAAVGIHPNDVQVTVEKDLSEIEQLAADPAVVAIGEVGLDFYRQAVDPAKQREVLSALLAIAQRRHLPILIHCRNAYDELLQLLRRQAAAPVRGIIHCASGPDTFIKEALALGLHISFAGNVTFPNAGALRALINLVPDDRLLIETDAPFLAPQPVRGQKNEPAHVAYTAAYLAQWRGTTVDALGALTTRNARQLFRIPEAAPPA